MARAVWWMAALLLWCGCPTAGPAKGDAAMADPADSGAQQLDAAASPDAAIAVDASEPTPAPLPACPGADDPGSGVDWIGSLSPAPERPPGWRTAPAALDVTVEVYAAGRTESPGQASGISARLWSNVTGSCQATPMAFDGEAGPEGHNDRFKASLPLAGLAPGIYRYRAEAGDGAHWRTTAEALLLVDPLVAADRVLASRPPSTSPDAQRDPMLRDLDACLSSAYLSGTGGLLDVAAASGLVHDFFRARLARAVARLETAPAGPEIVLLYDAGLVYRTASATVGIDVVLPESGDGIGLEWPHDDLLEAALAARLDVLLVTHAHPDHADASLMEAMVKAGKPVVGPASVAALVPGVQGLAGEGTLNLAGVEIQAFTGPHAYDDALSRQTDHRHYEVAPADGPRLLHTGDLDYTRELRRSGKPIGVAALKAGGVSPRYDDQSAADLGDDADAFLLAVDALDPGLVVPLHLMEVGHPVGGGREGYGMALDFRARVEAAGSRYAVLGWGEPLACSP